MQTAAHLLMIRPVRFAYNRQTAVNNSFQVAVTEGEEAVQQAAVAEFEGLVEKLRGHDIDVLVVNDTPHPHTPDSIFPNNWVSFHEDGTLVLYPMFAENRRAERKSEVLKAVKEKFPVRQTIDLTPYEGLGRYLEGTGSMVLDHDHHIAYACISPRTDRGLFGKACTMLGYRPIAFHAYGSTGAQIYHTNVMMCVADRYVVICLSAIPSSAEREMVSGAIRSTGKSLIEISMDQMNQFAGNMLQVENRKGIRYLVLSSAAYHSLTLRQQQQLEIFNPVIHSPLATIERHGGGSARCMIAEIRLPLPPGYRTT